VLPQPLPQAIIRTLLVDCQQLLDLDPSCMHAYVWATQVQPLQGCQGAALESLPCCAAWGCSASELRAHLLLPWLAHVPSHFPLLPGILLQLVLYARWPLDGKRVAALFAEGTRRSKEAKCECAAPLASSTGFVLPVKQLWMRHGLCG